MMSATVGRARSATWLLATVAMAMLLSGGANSAIEQRVSYDVLIRGGMVYDGTGGQPFVGDVGIRENRIVYVGPARPRVSARRTLDARGQAVTPGFINMLSWANETLLVDGRGLSDLRQGVTLEVMGEGWSMGPLTDQMKTLAVQRQADIKYPIRWTTMGDYLGSLERKGISVNVASFVGATTVRQNVLGEGDVDPSPDQLRRMRELVRQAMKEGALGLGTSLIYPPASFAETDELVALATEAAACGGMYISHMRSEGDRLLEASTN